MELEELDDDVFGPMAAPTTTTRTTGSIGHVKLAHFDQDPEESSERKPFLERPAFGPQVSRASLRRHKSHHSAVELNGSHLSIVDKTLLPNEGEPIYANMPKYSSFSQQKQLAWKPLMTPKFVINLFLICSLLFVPIGIILHYTSSNIYEFKYDYTDCLDLRSNRTCNDVLTSSPDYECKCRIYFNESRFQDETLLVYYMLENFYQNQRRYDRSRDDYQLLGSTDDYLESTCDPFRYPKSHTSLKIYKYAPCGAVANSLFNDTFNIYYVQKLTNSPIRLNISKKDLARDTDRKYKYRNPTNFIGTVKPINWKRNISMLENGYQNEDLMVWMRTAAFPSFKKLYGRILIEENSKLAHKIPIPIEATTANETRFASLLRLRSQVEKLFGDSGHNETWRNYTSMKGNRPTKLIRNVHKTLYRLPKGQYFIDIDYRYMVKQINGKKFFVLANVSWIGGKCDFLAMGYIVVGVLCFLAAVALFFAHIYHGNMDFDNAKSMVDHVTGLVRQD